MRTRLLFAFVKLFLRKPIYRIAFFTAVGLLTLQSSFAQQWNLLTDESTKAISSVASAYTSITVLDNIPYVVYVETATTSGIGKVKRRNASGLWEQVGGNLNYDISKNDGTYNNVTATRIYSDNNNKLYVTYIDVTSGRLAVSTFNTSTNVWQPLVTGTPASNEDYFASTGSATYTISGLSTMPRCGLAFDNNNVLYVTFSERSAALKYNTYVKSLASGAWQTVGTGPVSSDTTIGNSIAFDNNNVPYIVYIKQTSTSAATAYNNTSGVIKMFRFTSGPDWEDVSPPSPVSTTAINGARFTSIAMDANYNPIIAYFNSSNSSKSTILRCTTTPTIVWSVVQTTSTRDAPNTSLINDNGGNVYNIFNDALSSGSLANMVRVFKLYKGTSAFTELKKSTSNRGIDSTGPNDNSARSITISYPSIAVGSDTSEPYIVYTKTNSSNINTPIVQFFLRPVTTKSVTNITATSATAGGDISSDGVSTISQRGVVYSTSISPTTADSKVIDASGGTGSFISSITGLIAATTYHVRAYTISSTNITSYGNDVQFTTAAPDAGSVIVIDNGTTVTMKNGKVAVTITKSSATITNITYNNQNLLSGGYNGGQLYWSWNMGPYQQPSGCTYSLTADPHNNNFNYGEIKLHMVQDSTATTAALDMDIYYSLPRDTSGIYASATLRHPSSYGHANPGGEWRMAGYPGSTFNWLSVDSLRNKLMATNNDWGTPAAVPGAPPENMLLTTGIKKNQYECKYDYSADFGEMDAWGWSSTTDNVGLWMTAPSKEYYNGGPMKRELMCHASPTILNMLGGQHYGMGDDGAIPASENWEKTFGPFLIYCNSVPAGTIDAPIVLWKDAIAQAKKEQASWPYSWYTNPSYVQESGRGTITGKLAITDPGAPNASAANMWVGVAIPPANATSSDFQHWSKNYQFWVKTDADGNFTIPHVLASATPYNFYAFGPGANGQLTQNNFVTVTAGNTSSLGTISWTPTRTAATVWEIGTPDRSAKEFFHGSDWWRSDTTVGNVFAATHWAKFQDYPDEFPNGVNFTIGQSNIATDWNYVMNYDKNVQAASPVWTINFNLAAAPTTGSTASMYVALATNFSAALIATVNGTLITPTATSGAVFGNKSDAMIRMGIHGAFTDVRLNFPASNLHAGTNSIVLTERITGGATNGDLMFDYIRLEADGTTATVLPVTFGNIQAYQKEQNIQVDWQILTETNIKLYEVERSTDGQNFTKIGTVASKGNSVITLNYGLLDVPPNNGNNFYRVKSIGTDGTVQYSKIVKVTLAGNSSNSLMVYPNPIIGNTIGLQMNNFEKGNYILTLTNKLGQKVFNQTISNNGTISSQNILLDKTLATGVYQLKLVGNNKVVTQQVVKQ